MDADQVSRHTYSGLNKPSLCVVSLSDFSFTLPDVHTVDCRLLAWLQNLNPLSRINHVISHPFVQLAYRIFHLHLAFCQCDKQTASDRTKGLRVQAAAQSWPSSLFINPSLISFPEAWIIPLFFIWWKELAFLHIWCYWEPTGIIPSKKTRTCLMEAWDAKGNCCFKPSIHSMLISHSQEASMSARSIIMNLSHAVCIFQEQHKTQWIYI